jgi:hypothetical protein
VKKAWAVSSRTVWFACERGHGVFVKECRQKNVQKQ